MAVGSQSANDLLKLYDKLENQRNKLKNQLVEVESQFDAVSMTIKLLGIPTPGMSNINLAGLTHLDALIAIAKANNGVLEVKTARRLMTRAGMFTNPKNASSTLFTAISRSGRFISTTKGKYDLIDPRDNEPRLALSNESAA